MTTVKPTRAPRQPRYERLTAWKAADQLTKTLFLVTFTTLRRHPEIGDELRKSAIAVTQYIEMGTWEKDNAGFRRMLKVAIAKLVRISGAWLVVKDLKMLKPELWGEIEARRDHAERLTRGLYVALGRKSRTEGTTVKRRAS